MSRETDDDYPDVVLHLDDRHRIIRSIDTAPATQWIVQAHAGGRWRSTNYSQSKSGLRAFCGFVRPEELAIIDALPDWCPQRAEKTPAEHGRRAKSGEAATDVPAADESARTTLGARTTNVHAESVGGNEP
jgi:hypothetical protein